ncbi:T6SS effector phospholipase Tle3 domain-containing protein [Eleftheria terrae]|uniref:T6SS effector phospholipase Tle3 domain-containing protein n=1 Tax=Eleftheria terrae TaxID=1597781 RepID=UPI00263AD261|nr:DUF3274 domain-containing protein [Eleftheria terrae]WKB50896.1 DUF3274 domain-containing protein [Eleftheria terrae]
MGIYPEDKSGEAGQGSAVLHSNRVADRPVPVRPDLPGTVIVIHGVNDVGVSFGEVEQGICEGLEKRLGQRFTPGSFCAPTEDDKGQLVVDPDAVFFKRTFDQSTHSPVVPFYWGYREVNGRYKNGAETKHGQAMDRYGNRLDKDFSKGGGPFANATTTLPDMWKWGVGSGPLQAGDRLNGDPLRPVLDCPGRMYMILAAKRLAALISIIRDWDQNETVSIVAHSQGCMVSLLAQAFLLQDGLRPADTLILTHPPYSLVEDIPAKFDFVDMVTKGGVDDRMAGRYERSDGGRKIQADRYEVIKDLQTVHARVRTLAKIVEGVAKNRHTAPAFRTLKDPQARGVVGARWEESKDRDNRGKVYLYFCPEDRTVAIGHVQGIGWQGVPDYMRGRRVEASQRQVDPAQRTPQVFVNSNYGRPNEVAYELRQPLKEIGAGFFQRVFTARKRRGKDGKAGPVLVGQGAPHDFILRLKGEDDAGHVGPKSRANRAEHPEVDPAQVSATPDGRLGVRTINGEPLPQPVVPAMHEGAVAVAGAPVGAYEEVDPVDAAIATTSRFGYQQRWLVLDDPRRTQLPRVPLSGSHSPMTSPQPKLHTGPVSQDDIRKGEIEALLNEGKNEPGQRCEVEAIYMCLSGAPPRPNGKLLVCRKETPDEARARWQHGLSERSFHGAIFGSRTNHRQVTAYDVAVGQGRAPSDPEFYAYLCAIADWRMKQPSKLEKPRLGIMTWSRFISNFGKFYNVEPDWRKAIISGNSAYYSSGVLPACLPLLPEGLPPAVECQTVNGVRVKHSTAEDFEKQKRREEEDQRLREEIKRNQASLWETRTVRKGILTGEQKLMPQSNPGATTPSPTNVRQGGKE